MTSLVLASASPRRRELLGLLGLPFSVVATEIPETPQVGESPQGVAVRLSRAKARVAHARLATRAIGDAHTVIIGCDTVVALGDQILGKPVDAAEAWDMLQRLRNRWHTVYTGLALICALDGEQLTDVAATQVHMRDYTEEEIAAYIATGDPFDKAGAYAIQHAGFHPVSEIRGSYANVVGLPLCHLVRCLRRWRIEPRADVPAICEVHTGHTCYAHREILTGHNNGSRI